MKRFITFGSIEQFRNVVQKVKYSKQDDLPVLTAHGTEKIHGTNASVCFSNPDGFWVQSRKSILTPEADNAACAFHAEQNKDAWMKIIYELAAAHDIDLDQQIISVYFEWCGAGIQKNACVSGLDKMAIIFKYFKVSPIVPTQDDAGNEVAAFWLDTLNLQYPENRIRNVSKFPTVEVEIDFNRPDLAQNKMVELTEAVETNSGIANYFDKPDNIGEGYVWTIQLENGSVLRWKTKGEKHSNTKVNKLKPVDSEKVQRRIDFANYATPAWRLEQAWQTVFGIENEKQTPNVKMTGDFIRAVIADVMKEELDILAEKKLEPKDVNASISKIAVKWFMGELDKLAFKE